MVKILWGKCSTQHKKITCTQRGKGSKNWETQQNDKNSANIQLLRVDFYFDGFNLLGNNIVCVQIFRTKLCTSNQFDLFSLLIFFCCKLSKIWGKPQNVTGGGNLKSSKKQQL